VSERHLQPEDRLWWEADKIDVTSRLPYPDERWTYTDRAGHEHRYDKQAPGDYYPTLSWVIDETYYCPDCHDEHTEGHWECPQCGERITPGSAGPDRFRRYIPGLTHYYLNDEEITKDEYQRLAAEFRP
jgi:hypothetical protein